MKEQKDIVLFKDGIATDIKGKTYQWLDAHGAFMDEDTGELYIIYGIDEEGRVTKIAPW